MKTDPNKQTCDELVAALEADADLLVKDGNTIPAGLGYFLATTELVHWYGKDNPDPSYQETSLRLAGKMQALGRRAVERYFPDLDNREALDLKIKTTIKAPDVEIVDLGTELRLTADLPDVKKDDIDIELLPSSIEIKAEIKSVETRRERGYGVYERSLDLPVEVNPDDAEARYNNGVLEIIIRKKGS